MKKIQRVQESDGSIEIFCIVMKQPTPWQRLPNQMASFYDAIFHYDDHKEHFMFNMIMLKNLMYSCDLLIKFGVFVFSITWVFHERQIWQILQQ